MFQTDIEAFLEAMKVQAEKSGTAWVTGIPYWDLAESQAAGYPKYYNSIVASGDECDGLYKKQRLVPFGVYITRSSCLSWVLHARQNESSMSGCTRGVKHKEELNVGDNTVSVAMW